MTKVFLVDDHNLLRSGMASLVSQFEGYSVLGQAANGKAFIDAVVAGQVPDILILDIEMPVMNGEETAQWLKVNHPEIKILVLTMHEDETNILRMIRAGASGYILKDTEPKRLKFALDSIRDAGTYYSELVTNALKSVVMEPNAQTHGKLFTERETEFIQFACSDLTYKEIAERMNCGIRTVDSYRDDVFEKLGIKSRVALALYAVKNKFVTI